MSRQQNYPNMYVWTIRRESAMEIIFLIQSEPKKKNRFGSKQMNWKKIIIHFIRIKKFKHWFVVPKIHLLLSFAIYSSLLYVVNANVVDILALCCHFAFFPFSHFQHHIRVNSTPQRGHKRINFIFNAKLFLYNSIEISEA